MSEQANLPACERWLLRVFISKRSLPYVLEEIEKCFSEIESSDGFLEARKYLRWEIRHAATSYIVGHLKFLLFIEGISKITRLWF